MTLFKYKSLSVDRNGELDEVSFRRVVEPIAESYYFLPTRSILNDPNEGVFKNELQAGISAFLQGVVGVGERIEVSRSLNELANQVSQSTESSGVFSLSKTPIDELMWAHYANSHFGIVIEYELEQLTRFSSKEHLNRFSVQYSEHPPRLDLTSVVGKASNTVCAMLGHKSPRWSYEEEFRILLENTNGRTPHDFRAVKSITFGLKVPEHIRSTIFEATKEKVSLYFEMIQVAGTYNFERVQATRYAGQVAQKRAVHVDWKQHFTMVPAERRDALTKWAQEHLEHDPHFAELLLAERCTQDREMAVLQYEAAHPMELPPWVKYTKEFTPV